MNLYLRPFLIAAILAPATVFPSPLNELVINEILFNPMKDGYDYVEIYNRGSVPVDLADILIGNRNSTNDISSLKPLSHIQLILAPSAYAVITANEKWLKQHYAIPEESIICQVASLSSFPDDEGSAVIVNQPDSVVLDELRYNDGWHIALLDDPSGVALERISYQEPTGDKNNWTSASSSSGYGTPGAQNSQFRAGMRAEGEVIVSPHIFSPDNDGVEDFAFISLMMKEPGYLVISNVYDERQKGALLIKNDILGLQNRYRWDGFDDRSLRLPRGVYILATEIFNLKGHSKKFKNVLILRYRTQ